MVRHHSALEPLKTRPDAPADPRRRNSFQGTGPSPRSTVPLPSPTIVAARAYHLEQGTPIRPKADVLERRRSLIEGHQLPRRHSSTAGNLASQLESFSFGAGQSDLQPVPEIDEESPKMKIKIEDSRDIVLSGAEQEVQAAMEASRKNSEVLCGTPREILRQVPFEYTHEHLRDWGFAYLGNPSTADVFVNAVSLKRPSLSLAQEDEYQAKSSYLVMIRARVLPRAKDRKPFIIQRQFDIDELRASIPVVQSREQAGGIHSMCQQTLRRSSRARRSSAQPLLDVSSKRRGSSGSTDTHPCKSASLGEAGIPIHVEYALHYLPVLAALMLSGHVRRGDTIDLPLPHPEAWPDVVAYVYTGSGSLAPGMKANILYLAGHA